jgi:lipid-A-disaccharide synthase-like uncharacterized protein
VTARFKQLPTTVQWATVAAVNAVAVPLVYLAFGMLGAAVYLTLAVLVWVA